VQAEEPLARKLMAKDSDRVLFGTRTRCTNDSINAPGQRRANVQV
jgi:hypothetical protein